MKKYILLFVFIVSSFWISDVKSKDVTVYEFFYYGCAYCKKINKGSFVWKNEYLQKNDNFIYEPIPFVFNETSRMAAKHYYTAKILGIEDVFSMNYYHQLSLNGGVISDDLALGIMYNFADRDVVNRNMSSQKVVELVNYAESMRLERGVTQVPYFVISDEISFSGNFDKNKYNDIWQKIEENINILMEKKE